MVALAMLAALLAPAIQGVRSAANTAECSNHLHQLGTALANAESKHGGFPVKHHGAGNPSLAPLFPYLDQSALYDRLSASDPPSELPVVAVVLCPSDPYSWEKIGDANYFFNFGTRFRDSQQLNGFVPSGYRPGRFLVIEAREIIDGLSNTLAMSERLTVSRAFAREMFGVTDDDIRSQTGRYLWYTEARFRGRGDEHRAAENCRRSMTTPLPLQSGLWSNTWLQGSGYDHLLPPNHRGCYNDVPGSEANESFDARLIPPSSLHSGGVNALVADGQVRFIADAIADSVWRAIGTRAGGEVEGLR